LPPRGGGSLVNRTLVGCSSKRFKKGYLVKKNGKKSCLKYKWIGGESCFYFE
jgi:hypothetical protein